MSLTNKAKSPLYQTINTGYDIEELRNDAENYCTENNKDLRVYILGLKLIENSENQKDNIDKLFQYFDNINDFTNIWSKYTIEQLGNKDFGVINYCKEFKEYKKAIQDIINLLDIHKDNIPESTARSARSAARFAAKTTAESAAWSAARFAASSAEFAAKSAVWSARSAAKSAAWSAAKSAAWSAESARSARSAVWSAVWSAESAAKSAARFTAWKTMLNCYFNILEERQNENNC